MNLSGDPHVSCISALFD